jgi:hypothetical protein
MSYRRDKGNPVELRGWKHFLDENRSQFEATGLPQHVYDTNAVFDDFLMHGCLDHHAAPFEFSFDELTKDQATILREIVVRYFAAGFGDPGLMLFGSEEREAIHAEASLRSKEAR